MVLPSLGIWKMSYRPIGSGWQRFSAVRWFSCPWAVYRGPDTTVTEWPPQFPAAPRSG